MKQSLKVLGAVAVVAALALSGCKKSESGSAEPIDALSYTTIEGVNWGNFNVGAVAGDIYGNKCTYSEATSACPDGWRLPTKDEFSELKGTTWGEYKGAQGTWINVYYTAQIFLPCFKENASDELKTGAYWTSTEQTGTQGIYYAFEIYSDDEAEFNAIDGGDVCYVRCIKK